MPNIFCGVLTQLFPVPFVFVVLVWEQWPRWMSKSTKPFQNHEDTHTLHGRIISTLTSTPTAKRGTGRWLDMKHYSCFRVFKEIILTSNRTWIFSRTYHRTEQKVHPNTDKRLVLVIGRDPNTESVFHSWAATFASLVREPLNHEQTLPSAQSNGKKDTDKYV